MIAFLGIPALVWVIAISAVFFTAFYVACGLLIARFIRVGEEPEFEAPDPQQLDPADLDDWLAAEGPLEEFKVWERPESEVRVDRGVA